MVKVDTQDKKDSQVTVDVLNLPTISQDIAPAMIPERQQVLETSVGSTGRSEGNDESLHGADKILDQTQDCAPASTIDPPLARADSITLAPPPKTEEAGHAISDQMMSEPRLHDPTTNIRFEKQAKRAPDLARWIQNTTPDRPTVIEHPASDLPVLNDEMDPLPFDDTRNPFNWPWWWKWITLAGHFGCLITAMLAGSGFYPAINDFRTHLKTSYDLALLGYCLFYLGLGVGAVFLAPLSEHYGMWVWRIGFLCFIVLFAGLALVKSLPGFFVLRVLSGFAASITLVYTMSCISNVYQRYRTGRAVSHFVLCIILSMPLGNTLFSILDQRQGWRNVFWALMAICGAFGLLTLCVSRETSHWIKKKESERMNENVTRRDNGTADLESPKIRTEGQPLEDSMTRPYGLFNQERTVVLMAILGGLLNGLFYLFNAAFFPVFGKIHGLNETHTGISYMGLIVGIFIGFILAQIAEVRYRSRINATRRSTPEDRLLLAKFAGFILPCGLFFFAWTTFTEIHWIVPIVACVPVGFSFYILNLMICNYIVDCYCLYSASAYSVVLLASYLTATACSFLGPKMFSHLGHQYAGTVIASLSILAAPFPFVLKSLGPRLRPAAQVYTPPLVVSPEQETTEERQAKLSEKVDRIMHPV